MTTAAASFSVHHAVGYVYRFKLTDAREARGGELIAGLTLAFKAAVHVDAASIGAHAARLAFIMICQTITSRYCQNRHHSSAEGPFV